MQMEQLRWGFQNGLTIEQVQLYANPKLKSKQMQEIRFGLKSGLTMEQVQMYAKFEFSLHDIFYFPL